MWLYIFSILCLKIICKGNKVNSFVDTMVKIDTNEGIQKLQTNQTSETKNQKSKDNCIIL